ncbi:MULTISPECIES: matrixin family metalloprotease [Levilactobacillus]|uniref:matrixin family metalloprotease n=1 Tax=Levilactobacillus TaxID=2767886 RepID=UPI001951C3E4|nr:matrixin family metalloprotease [Levilactobacillus sp. 244-2]
MLKWRLLWVGVLVSLLCILWPGALAPHIRSVSRLDRLVNQMEGPLPSSKHAQTPLSLVAATYPLAPTYYYHFDRHVTANIRPIFEEAVGVFNRTGLVRLVPGMPGKRQNGLTFFTYQRDTSKQAGDFVELGEGGPTVKHRSGWQAFTVNRAKAGLNLAHPELRIRVSVAIHEIGHALGLAHSESRQSIMYPLDQQHETLSAADLRALSLLYQE